jgi:small subunit ribosomal protein S29
VLSNTNALPITGLEALSKDNMADAGKVGQMLSLDGPLLDQLREAKAFKVTQNWSLFRTPSVLMRDEAAELGADVQDVIEEKGTIRKLIVGEKASGKTVHLLQGMSLGFINNFVVINVPDCKCYCFEGRPQWLI